ncbi:hypothetical protein ACH5RR_032814 [Cinchona calisaya]|uniref:GB1/RHD3-type G domain-containing protein n=1 Tax=Cinchona calisaya TaxID=153742 RepID=A0ABD2YJ59_9GENT
MKPATLIDRNGNFNIKIEENLNLAAVVSPVSVVSIIGGQSSGKSTLLNCMFGTKFPEMDAASGRFQATKGIWVEKISSQEGCTLVIDTEGSDGKERGGDEKFEKQTALFALSISEVVIVNMMCTDLGRDKAAGWPLLRTAFEVLLRRFSTPREVMLLFVLRDKTDSPFEVLKRQLMGELDKLLNEVTGPQAQGNAALGHRMKIKVVATSHYLHQKKEFLREVNDLREWMISYTTSDERATERTTALGFPACAKIIWDEIKKNKDLNLPSYRIMVAEVQCNSIAGEKHVSFRRDKSWLQIEKDVESGEVVQGLGKKVSSLIDNYLSQYDKETQYYCETKRTEILKQLTANLLQVVEPTYLSVLERMRKAVLDNFEEAAGQQLKSKFELMDMKPNKFMDEFRNQLKDAAIEQANWNHSTKQLTQLESEITRYIQWVRDWNEHLDKKKQRQEFWLRVASIGGNVLTVSVCVAVATLSAGSTAAPIMPVIASSTAAIMSNIAAMTLLLAKNQEKEKEKEKEKLSLPIEPISSKEA